MLGLSTAESSHKDTKAEGLLPKFKSIRVYGEGVGGMWVGKTFIQQGKSGYVIPQEHQWTVIKCLSP